MSDNIRVLLIDDESSFCTSIGGEARNYNIQIIDAQDLEIGMEKLMGDNAIQFVILDGKCKWNHDQETADESFVHEAMDRIKE
jgi:hypothetical protein